MLSILLITMSIFLLKKYCLPRCIANKITFRPKFKKNKLLDHESNPPQETRSRFKIKQFNLSLVYKLYVYHFIMWPPQSWKILLWQRWRWTCTVFLWNILTANLTIWLISIRFINAVLSEQTMDLMKHTNTAKKS